MCDLHSLYLGVKLGGVNSVISCVFSYLVEYVGSTPCIKCIEKIPLENGVVSSA
jgi:hypothetical protein